MENLIVSTSPHIKSKDSIPKIMWTVVVALVPAGVGGVYFFGFKALWIIVMCVITAVVTEAIIQKIRGQKITIFDGSAVITGLLFAYIINSNSPWYVAIVGSFFAIFSKQIFGGLGCNIWNPALVGRAFVLMAWAAAVTSNFDIPNKGIRHQMNTRARIADVEEYKPDSLTGATPLNALRSGIKAVNDDKLTAEEKKKILFDEKGNPVSTRVVYANVRGASRTHYMDLFLGNVGGCIGETSCLLLIIGALLLFLRKCISWHIPIPYILTVFILTWALPVKIKGQSGTGLVWFAGDPIFHILAGGLMLGAFFMATDMVTSPITKKGMIIFGIGCGVLTSLIRLYGGYPEGVCYSILLMNTATPLIDRFTRPRKFGEVKKSEKK